MPYPQLSLAYTVVEVRMSNDIPLFDVDGITYSSPKFNTSVIKYNVGK